MLKMKAERFSLC